LVGTAVGPKIPSQVPTPIETTSGLKLEVTSVTFHEGFRAPGLKAVDVVLKFTGSTPMEGKIISITGTSGKVYSTDGVGGRNWDTTTHEITCFRDVADTEKNIVSIMFLDTTGAKTEITIKGITPKVTHK